MDQVVLQCADGVRRPDEGEQVGWYVTDPLGLVVDWGPPAELEMVTFLGDPESGR